MANCRYLGSHDTHPCPHWPSRAVDRTALRCAPLTGPQRQWLGRQPSCRRCLPDGQIPLRTLHLTSRYLSDPQTPLLDPGASRDLGVHTRSLVPDRPPSRPPTTRRNSARVVGPHPPRLRPPTPSTTITYRGAQTCLRGIWMAKVKIRHGQQSAARGAPARRAFPDGARAPRRRTSLQVAVVGCDATPGHGLARCRRSHQLTQVVGGQGASGRRSGNVGPAHEREGCAA
jgi:hypothetical protein